MPKEQETREVLRRFRREGWIEEHGKGGHVLFRKGPIAICVPAAKREIPIGTYRSIAKAAGWIEQRGARQ